MPIKPLRGVLSALCLGIMLYAYSAAQGDPAHFAALHLDRFPVPIDLPELSLPDVDGKNVSLRSWQGRIILLNFWTTW